MTVPDLPEDLLAFLRAAPRPELPTGFRGEPLALLTPEELTVETLPVSPNTAPFHETHPHVLEYGCYEVPAVNLVRGDRFPAWLFLWLPVERRYGSRDLDHSDLMTFLPDPTWADIVADPQPYVSASDGDRGGPVTIEHLEPWHRHPWVEDEDPDLGDDEGDFTPTRVAVIDGSRVTCEADFWREYLDAVKPEGAEHFGRSLAAFRDAVTAGGPGWPGDGCLLRVVSHHAMKVSGEFKVGLNEIAWQSDGFRLVFA